MSLTVEDGTGLVDADALISTEEADLTHLQHGNTEWEPIDQQDKEAAIRNATIFLTHSLTWAGFPVNQRDQAVCFPRVGVTDRYGYDVPSDAVPREVKLATAFLALYDSANSGDLTQPKHDDRTVLKRKKIGEIEKEYAIFTSDPTTARPIIVFAMELIRPFLSTAGPSSTSISGGRLR